MNRESLAKRARSYVRDLNSSTFRDIDVHDYINEGIDRVKNVIPELRGMLHLTEGLDIPILLPDSYHYLLSLYSASRLFSQDERYHQSTNLMNEFEVKLAEMSDLILAGDLDIVDSLGVEVTFDYHDDHVENVYFTTTAEEDDEDELEA